MSTQIFLNLAVKDLNRSVAFFSRLGFRFDQNYTDENATCMVVGDNIFVMLLVESFFRSFTGKQLCDTSTSQEAMTAISVGSRAQVDEMADRALEAGATSIGAPQDHGWMYTRGFEDLDGHHWEFMFMDQGASADA